MIQVIKSSRAILVLFILYVCIAIAVFALNGAAKSKEAGDSDSSSKTTENAKISSAELSKFQDEVTQIFKALNTYVVAQDIDGEPVIGSCVRLSDISDYTKKDYTQGSAYIYGENEISLWFTDGKHYISDFDYGDEVTEDDISSGFLTEYYNSCGAE